MIFQSDVIVDNHALSHSLWVEDGNGHNLMLVENPLAERIEGNRFKQEFAMREINGLQLKSYKHPKPILYEEFEIEIP
ncbi:hypothetical protein [Bacillus solitudinis]|uniref:hypothetical protein n=1 Tax=Bacillus solitudinis TaxID=2014074 RepID=UPI000C238DC4|nr:hypothetical protein [Bacillus solitudinis]